MPTKCQQQRLRRMKKRELKFEALLKDNKCVSLPELYEATNTDLQALIRTIKEIIKHNAKVSKLVEEGVMDLSNKL